MQKNPNRTKLDIVGDIYDNIIEKYRNENRRCQVIKSDVAFIVDEFLNQIRDSLMLKKTVELRGFGTFILKKRAGKANSRNPKTGELVATSDHYVPSFKPGTEFKKTIKLISDGGEDVS